MRINRSLLMLVLAAVAAATVNSAGAQPRSNPLGEDFKLPGLDGLGGLQGIGSLSPAGSAQPVTIDAKIAARRGSSRGRLIVRAVIEEPYHIYSTTQPKGGPKATIIKLKPNQPVRLLEDFETTTPPKTHIDDGPWKGLLIEEHFKVAEWIAPVEISAGTSLDDLEVEGFAEVQACDPTICIPLLLDFTAKYDATAELPAEEGSPQPVGPQFVGSFSREGSLSTVSGHVEPAVVPPGGEARLVLTITPAPGWHAYALEDVEPPRGSKSTLIVLESTDGLSSGEVTTEAPIIEKEPSAALKQLKWPTIRYYQGPVSWTVPIQIPSATPAGPRQLQGVVGFQICQDDGQCETPQATRFHATIQVDGAAAPAGQQPLSFTAAEYADAARLAARRAGTSQSVQAQLPIQDLPDASATSTYDLDRIEFREIEQRSIAYYLAIAFLGGLILNLMPCVLPVIGLKVMSFVQQAGQNRSQAFMLNIWYSAGILVIFLLMAGLAVGAGTNMGDQFGNLGFNVFMCALIFAMALSLLGVWEIPIPGFVGGSSASKLMDREGPTGAFLKGVFTTILATPCLGPLMAPALGWAVQQPASTSFSVFAAVGLGMALPYLVIGAFPRLIRFIPKPGAWMVTFKQMMGFILIGTVIFFLSFMPPESVAPTVLLLAGIGLACWWIARIPITADFSRKLSGWLAGGVMAAGVAWLAFGWLYQQVTLPRQAEKLQFAASRRVGQELEEVLVQLRQAGQDGDLSTVYTNLQQKLASLDSGPYQPFTLAKLEKFAIEEGRTVLVDFTADWCLNCKTLEAAVLHSSEVEQSISDNNVVTMKADYTDHPPYLAEVLRALKSNGVPVIAIFPGGDPYRPFVFRGAYSSDGVLAALEEASSGAAIGTLTAGNRNSARPQGKTPDVVATTASSAR